MPVLIVILVIVLVLVLPNIKIVPQSKTFVIERLGSYKSTWQTGLHFKIPFIERIANKYQIPVTLLCDTNHILNSEYSEVIVVGAGADAVDYKLISICRKGDIVVSQDYGVAAMALGKGAFAIHQSGKWYTDDNIDKMLMERHLNKKARRSNSKNHIKGPRKRTEEDDNRFAESFEKLICLAMKE